MPHVKANRSTSRNPLPEGEVSPQEWADFIDLHPHAHLLQTPAWGALKANFGWQPAPLIVKQEGMEIGGQLLFRRLALPGQRGGFSIAYLPKGPVFPESNPEKPARHIFWAPFWQAVDQACRRRGAIFLKVEPDLWESIEDEDVQESPLPSTPLLPAAVPLPQPFLPSPHAIQPPRTIVVDLSGDEERILGRMKQKTRYNIRLGLKRGVVVQPTNDLETFYRLVQITGERDGFGVHNLAYYQKAYSLFQARSQCELLVASHNTEPLAALMVFFQGRRAWYLYGASSNQGHKLMPSYTLQWAAMRRARQLGCLEYDLWGVPDENLETLEAQFSVRSDGLWGVYRFKRGFGGQLRRSAGPWERVYRPLFYRVYRLWLGRRQGE